MKKMIISLLCAGIVMVSACTNETRNKLGRGADNLFGEDLKVSYIDYGKVVKEWTVKKGKITSGKSDAGDSLGYYYFWSEETGYVQVPIAKTVIEEIKK